MTGDKQTPAERWQAAVDAETALLRAEFNERYANKTDEEITATAAEAVRIFGRDEP